MSTLYDLTEQCATLLHALEAIDAMEMPEEDRDLARAALEAEYWAADGELAAKAEGYVAIAREMASRAALRKAEATRLTELVKADEAGSKRLLKRLQDSLELLGYGPKRPLQTAMYRLSIQGNGGTRAMEVEDEEALRAEYPELFEPVTTYVLSQGPVRAAIEAWEAADPETRGDRPYPGVTLKPRGTRLVIR